MALALMRLLTLLGCGLLIGLLELPLQWISELGFQLQALWPMGTARTLQPALVALPLLVAPLFLVLAWGPLAAGRGGGLGGCWPSNTAVYPRISGSGPWPASSPACSSRGCRCCCSPTSPASRWGSNPPRRPWGPRCCSPCARASNH